MQFPEFVPFDFVFLSCCVCPFFVGGALVEFMDGPPVLLFRVSSRYESRVLVGHVFAMGGPNAIFSFIFEPTKRRKFNF